MNKDRRKQPAFKQRNQEVNELSYRSLIENIKDYAIFMLDKKGKVVSWDQGGTKLFGYKRNDIVGKKFSVLFTSEDIKRGLPNFDMEIAVEEGRHLDERQYVRKNKSKFWSSGVLTSTKDKKGVHQGFSKIMRDVTQQTDLHNTAVHNSTHDFLTGMPNRNFFEESLIESIKKTKRGSVLGIFYMDFNNFKRTNDEQGHRFGDLVLIEIAHRLIRNIRMSDVAARFGGDEFVILAKNLKNQPDVARFAQKIISVFRKPIVLKKRIVHTSISMGIALYPQDGKNPGELLRFSDMALYQAKKLGGNQFQFFTKESKAKLRPNKVLKRKP